MFKSKKEKWAYVQGLKAGARGKTPRREPNYGSRFNKRNDPPRAQSFDIDDFFGAAVEKSNRDYEKHRR